MLSWMHKMESVTALQVHNDLLSSASFDNCKISGFVFHTINLSFLDNSISLLVFILQSVNQQNDWLTDPRRSTTFRAMGCNPTMHRCNFFFNLISTCKCVIIHRGQSKKRCKMREFHKTIKISFYFIHKVWKTYHIFTIKVNALMPTIGYPSNVILIEWKWLHRSVVFEKFLNFVEYKALKFLNISNNLNAFNLQQLWKINVMF